MTKAEFVTIIRVLKGNYRYGNFIPDENTADSWFNILNQYQYQDIMAGVTEYMAAHSEPPMVSDIARAAKAAAEVRKFQEKEKQKPAEKTVKCPYCGDRGYTMKIYPNGSDFMTPCSCARGRENFPWYFMPEEELKRKLQEEQRQGKRPTIKPFRATAEFRKRYLSDTRRLSEVFLEMMGRLAK